MQFLTHGAFAVETQSVPVRGEPSGVGNAHTKRADEIVERFNARKLFRRQANDLPEAAVQCANFLVRANEHYTFLEPLNNIQNLGNAVLSVFLLAVVRLLFQGCKKTLSTALPRF